MELSRLKEMVDEIDSNSKILQTSLLRNNHCSFSNIFNNIGDKPLGEAMFCVLSDLYKLSLTEWKMDKDDWIDWIIELDESAKQ